jgi:hypothetical protein
MSIKLGTDIIPQFKLGVINLNKIMLGVIEIFPNLAPSGVWTPLDLPNLLAWYDPSDLSTMFQSANSMEPVTASGQPVGVMLDKSQNLALGPEMLANNDFDNGWININAGAVITGTTLVCNIAGNNLLVAQHPVSPTWVLGAVYEITFVISAYTSGGVGATDVFAAALPVGVSGVGTHKQYYFCQRADFPNTRIMTTSGGFVGTLDSVSIKRIEGDTIAITTAAARPLYQSNGTLHWLLGDGVDDVLFGTLAPELEPPWEFWAGAQVNTSGGINIGIFGVAPSASGGSTGVRTGGLFRRTDGSVRQLSSAVRVGGNANNNVNIANTFDLGQAFVLRGAAGVSPDTIFVEEGGVSNSAPSTYGATNGDNAYRIFQQTAPGETAFYGGVANGSALSTADATELQAYLDAKTGITP